MLAIALPPLLLLQIVLLVAPLSTEATRINLNHRRTTSELAPFDAFELALASIRNKYAGVLPQIAPGRRAAGDVELTNLYADATYTADVMVGTPGQALSLILDTGSSDLWISSSACTTCTGADDLFADAKSTTLVSSSSSFAISYGSGSAQGQLATDTVALGSFTVPKQTFGLVSKASNNLIFSPISGILGFGFQALSQSGATPWWLSLVGSWPSPLFAFYLTRHSSSSNGINPGGTLTLGHTDESLYEGVIAWNTVTSQTYWTIATDGAVVGGQAVAFSGNKGTAIDTGTTLCLGPVADVAAIYKQIPGAREVSTGSWVLPCSTTTTVAFSFGGTVYPFASADLMRGLYKSGGSECIGAITGLDLGAGAPMGWIIGAAWLKNVYTVFRQSPASVGFAFLPGEAPPASASPSSSTRASSTVASLSSSSAGQSSSSSSSSSSSRSSSSALTMTTSPSASATAPTEVITGGIVTIDIPQTASPATSSASVDSGGSNLVDQSRTTLLLLAGGTLGAWFAFTP